MSARENYGEDASLLSLLTREQERRLRAQAWRHVRRLNASVARKLWRRARDRDQMKQAA